MLWIFGCRLVLEGYIIEFVAENHQAFSKAKAIFREGARGILLQGNPSMDQGFISRRRNVACSFSLIWQCKPLHSREGGL
jgi:hypothetical protein